MCFLLQIASGTCRWSEAAVCVAQDEEGVEDEDYDDEDSTSKKTVKKTVYDWELLNDSSAIWLRNPGEVEDEEYHKFYKSLAKVRNVKGRLTDVAW